jgi:hypothetical protein
VQIDVVGLRDDDFTDLGECKWGTVHSGAKLADALASKAKRFPNARNATVGLRAFVRKKPRSTSERVRWHDLDDLYGA